MRVDEGTDQPGPDSAVMIGAVAFTWPSGVAPHITRLAERQAAQTVGRQQMTRTGIDNGFPPDRLQVGCRAGRRRRSDWGAAVHRSVQPGQLHAANARRQQAIDGIHVDAKAHPAPVPLDDVEQKRIEFSGNRRITTVSGVLIGRMENHSTHPPYCIQASPPSGNWLGSMPSLTRRRRCAGSLRPSRNVGRRSCAPAGHLRVAAPIAEPGIIGDHRLVCHMTIPMTLDDELIGGQRAPAPSSGKRSRHYEEVLTGAGAEPAGPGPGARRF
jgi:hypothetical protein